jgi:outer membrane protein OmpA-like peptidoglycan-associated protein
MIRKGVGIIGCVCSLILLNGCSWVDKLQTSDVVETAAPQVYPQPTLSKDDWTAPMASFTYMDNPDESDVAAFTPNRQHAIGTAETVTHVNVTISWINDTNTEDQDPDGEHVKRARFYFRFDSSRLAPMELNKLQDTLAGLKGKNYRIVVEGRTDSRGTTKYNQLLSQRRAETIRKYMADHGMKPNRIVVRAYGENDPIAGNDTDAGRQKNRSVTLRWLNP